MYKTLYNTTETIYNAKTFYILTFIVEQPDGLAVEYWINPKNDGRMFFTFGGMLADELDASGDLSPDLELIADYIDWDEIEKD